MMKKNLKLEKKCIFTDRSEVAVVESQDIQ